MRNITNFRYALVPEPLVGICNTVLTDMMTKVLLKMDICCATNTFKVVSIEPYESRFLVGEPMKCAFLGSILVLGRGRPGDSHSRAISGDSLNLALGITFLET